ncbi:hypothetical protein Prum_067460 [Phytohabitans rumicis]|uniref:Uncharacterized protein n=1 Tax=Phytohabitans rumicis TaxID=1076125 RepID=A0A6V8L9V0_9ACTN|nr:hypothetical protein Prum_067460 [Phytohabitans rumicis]
MIYPWVIAAAARENIAFGNEYRSDKPITTTDLGRLRNTFTNLHDPFLNAVGEPGALDSFLVRVAFEQFPYQHSRYEDMSRILLLFDRDYTGLGCAVTSTTAWERLLCLPVDAFMRASFLILVSAHNNAGWFDPGWLSQPNVQPALEAFKLTGDDVMNVFRRVFATDLATVKRRVAAERLQNELLRRYEFNPLMETPFVQMPDGRYLAPSTHFVAQRLSPASLYYVGLSLGVQEVSSDLGKITETYVGEQLALVDTELVLHDVEYAKGQRAADYVVVLPGVTLVVEVKSARVARLGRLDQAGYLDDLNKDVGKALRQIQRTGNMIRASHAAFTQVDPTQEIRGIVVTAEPHYMLNSPAYRDQIADPGFPTVILSLSELEHAIAAAHAGRPADLFTALTAYGANGIDVNEAIRSHEHALGIAGTRNPLLDAAYQRAWGDISQADTAS